VVVRGCQIWAVSRMGWTVHSVFVIVSPEQKLVWGWALSWRRRTSFIFWLGWTLQMHCCSLFKVLLNQRISTAFVVCCHCHYRPASSGLVSDFCFTTLKMPDPTSYCTHINSMLPIHTFQAPVNFYGTDRFWQWGIQSLLSCFVCISITSAVLNCVFIGLMWLILVPITYMTLFT
jgi:hypothetical protein